MKELGEALLNVAPLTVITVYICTVSVESLNNSYVTALLLLPLSLALFSTVYTHSYVCIIINIIRIYAACVIM